MRIWSRPHVPGRVSTTSHATRPPAAPPDRRPAIEWARIVPIWAGAMALDVVLQPQRAIGYADRGDLLPILAGARLVRAGMSSSLYNPLAQAGAQMSLTGHPLTNGFNPYGNPPAVAWLTQPLTAVSLPVAVGIVSILSVVAVALTALVLASLTPSTMPPLLRVTVGVSAAATLPLAEAITYGQLLPILALGAALSLRTLVTRGDCLAAGLWLAPLAVKPQLLWLVLPLLLIARGWRTAAGLVGAGAGWVIASLAVVGPAGLLHYAVDYLPSGTNNFSRISAGLPGLLVSAGLPEHGAVVAALGCAAAALLVAWYRRDWVRASLPRTLVAGITLSAVCSPHIWGQDVGLAVMGVALVARRRGAVPAVAIASAFGAAALIESAIPLQLRHLEGLVALGVVLSLPAEVPGSTARPLALPGARSVLSRWRRTAAA